MGQTKMQMQKQLHHDISEQVLIWQKNRLKKQLYNMYFHT